MGAQAMSVADLRSVALAAGMDAAEGPGPPGLLRALNVFHRKSVLYGAFVWAHRALNDRKLRFPARAVGKVLDSEPLCQAAVAAGARRPELEAVNTQSDPKAGLDEALLSFFLRHPRLYGESL